jgi:ribonuclease P protein subunit POP4
MRADYHGAEITVVHSQVDSYIGLQGIIINESLKTFKIITPQHRTLTLLKPQVVLQFQIGEKYYLLNGNCLSYRATDRSKVKFKSKKPEAINLSFLTGFLNDSNVL